MSHDLHSPCARLIWAFAALCAVAFAVLTITVAREVPVDVFDGAGHSWFLERRQPWLTQVALWVTSTGTSAVVVVLLVLVALAVTPGSWVRRAAMAVLLPAVLMAGVGVRLWFSDLVVRPRPLVADWAGYASGYAYPSGHTTASAMAAGLLLWLLLRTTPPLARVVGVMVIIWAVAVGVTRIYLGVHWPTDVVAGWLFAATWVTVFAGLTRTRWTRTDRKGRRSAPMKPTVPTTPSTRDSGDR